MRRSQTIFALMAAWALPACAVSAAPPKLDYTNVGAYMRALRQSNDPAAKAILKQIEDGPADLKRERALTEQAGIPLVAPTPNIPDDQNAAPLYTQWSALRKQRPFALPNYAETLSYHFQYTPEQLARVRKIFDDNHDAIGLLHRAADRPSCVFPGDSFTQYASLREAAREIKTESYLLAHDGRYTDAIANNARGFRIARQVGSGQSYIAYLVGAAMESITLSGMDDVLYLAGPNQDVDLKVQDAVRSSLPDLSLKGGLSGDVAEMLKVMDRMRTASPDDFATNFGFGDASQTASATSRPFTPEEREFVLNVLDAAEARYLSGMRAILAASDLPPAERHVRFTQFEAAWSRSDAGTSAIINPVETMAQELLSVFVKSDSTDDRLKADEEVTMAAAAVLAEKARTGQFPAALSGDFPDPFSGKPLGYRKEGADGFVVYSVGPDGTFDGGKPGDPWRRNIAVFRYPAPAPKPVPQDMQ